MNGVSIEMLSAEICWRTGLVLHIDWCIFQDLKTRHSPGKAGKPGMKLGMHRNSSQHPGMVGAMRVPPAVTRLTVYRRCQVEVSKTKISQNLNIRFFHQGTFFETDEWVSITILVHGESPWR